MFRELGKWFQVDRPLCAQLFQNIHKIRLLPVFLTGMAFKPWEWLLQSFSWRWEVMGKTLFHSTEDNEGGWHVGPRSHSATEGVRHYFYSWIWQSHLEWSRETPCSQGLYVLKKFHSSCHFSSLFLETETNRCKIFLFHCRASLNFVWKYRFTNTQQFQFCVELYNFKKLSNQF